MPPQRYTGRQFPHREYRSNMKTSHIYVLAAALIPALSALCTAADPAPATPASTSEHKTTPPRNTLTGTALIVNEDAVTSTKVIVPLGEKLQELAQKTSRDEFRAQALPVIGKSVTDQVYQVLLYQRAKQDLDKRGVPEEAIETLLAERREDLLSEYGGVEARARTELARKGSSLEEELEAVRRRIVVDTYQEMVFVPTLRITRGQMLRYYRAHQKDKFSQESLLQFQLIDIRKDKFETPSQASDAIRQAQQKLKGGADFAALARECSHGWRKNHGGLWNPQRADSVQQHYKPVIKALDKIDIGQCTDIVETDDHFFIAKLISHQEDRVIPFAQAQFEIARLLRQERWRKYTNGLSAKLLKKATIGDWEKFVADTINVAYDRFNNAPNEHTAAPVKQPEVPTTP